MSAAARPSGRVLVTGANGFVGRALCQALAAGGVSFRAAVRRWDGEAIGAQPVCAVGDLAEDTDWSAAISQMTAVVHLASRVHVMNEPLTNVLPLYRQANTQASLNLARQAAAAGVQRFVFVSTVKVNGEGRVTPYCESDPPCPTDPYAISKWEAEQGLRKIAADTGMQVVVVRPPLVYGPGVKANFLNMMRWVYRGVPLPLGAIHNRRSLVALGNLVDFLMLCISHPAAANQTFLVSDGEDLSTTELLVRMAAVLGKPSRLLPVPTAVLGAGAALLGKRGFSRRLCGSLCVDISKARTVLGWSPPVSVDEGLRRAATDFLANRE